MIFFPFSRTNRDYNENDDDNIIFIEKVIIKK